MKNHRISFTLLVALGCAAFAGCGGDDGPTSPPPGGGGGPTFTSGNMVPGAVYVRTFTEIGDWNYGCSIHPTMTGIVNVTASSTNDSVMVSMPSSTFSPSNVLVKPGGYVKWTNTGTLPHTVTRN